MRSYLQWKRAKFAHCLSDFLFLNLRERESEHEVVLVHWYFITYRSRETWPSWSTCILWKSCVTKVWGYTHVGLYRDGWICDHWLKTMFFCQKINQPCSFGFVSKLFGWLMSFLKYHYYGRDSEGFRNLARLHSARRWYFFPHSSGCCVPPLGTFCFPVGERRTGSGERGTGSFFIAPFYGKLQEITQCHPSVTLLNGSNKC